MNKLLVKSSGFGPSSDFRPTLLLLHGWGMNSNVWKTVLEPLQARYQIHCVDLPGHGFNATVEAHSMQDIVDQLSVVIDDLVLETSGEKGNDKIHLIGWSLGGLIAQALAISKPEKISSLTLVASTLRFSQDDDPDHLWPHAMSFKALNKVAENLQNDTQGTLKRFIALQFMGVASAKQVQRELIASICHSKKVPESGEVTSASLSLGLKLLAESDFRKVESKHPEHWIFAEKDRLIPAAVINDLKSLRADAQITLLKNAGHAPFMTHPDEFMSAVLPFIDCNVIAN